MSLIEHPTASDYFAAAASLRNQPTEPLTISVEEAAKLLGIGRTNAYRLARRGELPGVKQLGRLYLVSRPALLHWLDQA